MEITAKQARELPGSLLTSIRAMSEGGSPVGLAKEISDTVRLEAARQGHAYANPSSLIVPFDNLRTLYSGSFTAGGALVAGDSGSPSPALRAASVCIAAGAQVLEGIKAPFQIPREATVSTISWLHELESTVDSEGTFGQLTLSPRRAAGSVTITRQLESQTNSIASAFLAQSLSVGVAKALDKAALAGTGGIQPVGIPSVAGVNSVTFSGAATWTNVLDVEKAVLGNDGQTVTFIGHPDVKKKWRTVQRFTGSDLTLWHPDSDTIAGHQAMVTTAASATGIIAGDFSQMVFGIFGQGIELIVDQFMNARTSRISIVVNLLADCGLLRPSVFAINSGSVIQ